MVGVRVKRTTRKGKTHNYIVTVNGYTHATAGTVDKAVKKGRKISKKRKKKGLPNSNLRVLLTPVRV